MRSWSKEVFSLNIGKKISELRNKNGMSQQALADSLFVSRDLVSKWENGTRRPNYRMIEKIAEVFNAKVDEIVDTTDLVFKELFDGNLAGIEISDADLAVVLDRFLRSIPEKDADIFINRYYHLKNTAEIAEAYGIRENHVRSILSKTRAKLARYIKESKKNER